jgi:threonine/homoserine/homoserine lactone efflux protein
VLKPEFYLCGVEILNGFLVGLGTGVFITWFPGMLNMQAVATSVRAGERKAYAFSGGLAVVIGAQTALGVLFADLLTRNPAVIAGIKSWAIPLFLILAAVFTWKGFRARAARRAEIERPYKGGPFWRGMMMSSMNILNIPLIFAIAGWLIGDGYLSRDFLPRLAYVPGTALGTLGVFFLYVLSADWISKHAAYFTRNINFFLGGLFVLLAVIQAIQMIDA